MELGDSGALVERFGDEESLGANGMNLRSGCDTAEFGFKRRVLIPSFYRRDPLKGISLGIRLPQESVFADGNEFFGRR